MNKLTATLVAVGVALVLRYMWTSSRVLSLDEQLAQVAAPEILANHTQEFKKREIVQVVPGVHVAVNYALGNSILLEAPDGLIVIDTTESAAAAADILREFRRLSNKPVRALIYTHHHADHCHGAQGFVEDPVNPPDIWAHELFAREIDSVMGKGLIHHRRAMYQFGTHVLNRGHTNSGIGPQLKWQLETSNQIMPNKLVHGREENITIAGLDLTFLHIPGESADQLGIWLPDRRILFAADDIYKSFPNLYAIRGVPPRDVMHWVTSLERMRTLRPQHLVMSHFLPIEGAAEIEELFNVYIAAIRFVHDQTVRLMNKNLHIDEIAQRVRLPQHLLNHRYLWQVYGTVPWSVKGVYEQYMGWFSGDPVDLNPLPPRGRAERMVALVGVRGMVSEGEAAVASGDHQWALELATHVLTIHKGHVAARQVRLDALKGLAAKQTSSNGRNYYLTAILDDHGMFPHVDVAKFALHFPMKVIFKAWKVRVKAELVEGVNTLVVMNFTDTKQVFRLHLHDSILDVDEEGEVGSKDQRPSNSRQSDLKLTTTTQVLRELIAQLRSPFWSYVLGDMTIEGGVFNFRTFMDYFDRSAN